MDMLGYHYCYSITNCFLQAEATNINEAKVNYLHCSWISTTCLKAKIQSIYGKQYNQFVRNNQTYLHQIKQSNKIKYYN